MKGEILLDDSEIVNLFWERSERAISALAAKYGGYCLSVAQNILRSREDAEECVNDAYTRAWNAIPPARPEKLQTFLGKITRNLSFDRHEKNNAAKRGSGVMALALQELEECVPDKSTVESALDSKAVTDALNSFLSGLEPFQRVVFMRRYWHAETIEEVSARLGISTSKTKSTLFRMRKKLKIHLLKEGIAL
jgi:RNA polymerase sigma-70 factor (ECF subfamily)